MAQLYPLTPRQRLMWIEDRLNPGIPLNNVVTLVEIDGNLDFERLKTAFTQVLLTHDAMRMTVVRSGSEFYAQLLNISEQVLEFIDVSNETDEEAAFAHWQQQKCSRTFNLGDITFDAAVVRLHRENYIFFLNQHQAFTDKNSARDFFKYLDRAYNCQQPGATEQDTRAQSSSYAEFLLDEDLYSKSTKAREGNQFWAQKYATPPVDFRPYGQRHARNSPLNDCHDVKLDSAIAEKIGSLTEKVPASNLFLLIAFAFLRKVTGSHDLCIDVPIDNRRPDYSGTLGCFIEPSPIRLAADLNDSFDELYSKMQDEIRECMQHCRQVITDSKLPHELLVDFRVIEDLKFVGFPAKLRQKRALTILNESFEGPRSAKHWGGLHSLVIDIAHLPTTNEYRISFEFNRGAWSEPGSQMQAIRHFLAILDAFLQDSSQTLTETGSLVEQGTHDEQFLRQMAIADVNEKRIPLIEHWRKQVPTHASRIALGQGNELLTHLQLSDRVESFAWGLTSLGVRRGDRVLVFSEASIQQTVAMLAVFSIGAVHVPVDPATPTERVSAIISNTDPVLVLVAEASHDLALPKKRKSSSLLSEVFCTPNRFGGATPSLSDPAYIIHTSGSSGAPKSVEISHGALASFSEAWSSAAEVDHSDRILQLSSPSFDASLAALVPALFEGAACILPDESWLQSPRELFNAIEKHGITIVKGPTAFFITIVYELEKGLPHPRGALRCWIMGGSEFPRDVVAKYSRLAPTEVALVNSYGPTETTVIVSSARLSSTETGPSGHVPIGKPLKTAGFRVVDGFGRELPLGVVGELWISGPQLATRYLGDEAKTQEKFPIDTAKTRWYRSGDLVRWRHDGQLEYFGRIDRQIQVRGFRVEPGEIETHLRKHEGVKNSYVSLMNLRGQDELIAFVATGTSTDVSTKAIREQLAAAIPHYSIPSRFILMETIPLNTSGKPDEVALSRFADDSRLTEERQRSHASVAPRTELERMLQEIWQRNLGVSAIGLDDEFMDVGGDSLRAVVTIIDISNATSKPLSPQIFFANQTIRKLAMSLAEESDPDYSIVKLNERSEGTPLFCFCGIYLYQPLADSLRETCPVYGMYVREESDYFIHEGRAGNAAPLEELVNRYSAAIREHQPEGPYRLGGLSFGGVVAYEVAQKLRTEGHDVDLVALFDTVLYNQIEAPWLRRAAYAGRRQLKRIANGFLSIATIRRDSGRASGRGSSSTWLARRPDTSALRKVLQKYRPSTAHQFPTVLFRALDREKEWYGNHDESLGWRQVVGSQLRIHNVKGGHTSILDKQHVDQLSRELAKYFGS